MDAEVKKDRPKLDFSKAQILFANIMNLHFNGEEVVLSFGVKEHKNDQQEIIISHRVYMSLPHFVRAYGLFSGFMQQLEEKKLIEEIKHDEPKKID
jgi:hypothetical protein